MYDVEFFLSKQLINKKRKKEKIFKEDKTKTNLISTIASGIVSVMIDSCSFKNGLKTHHSAWHSSNNEAFEGLSK